MFKLIGKAVAALLLTKKARNAVGRPPGGGGKPAVKSAAARGEALATQIVTPERAELIRKAMQVRAAKQTILADLSDEQRSKLVAQAVRSLMNKGQQKE